VYVYKYLARAVLVGRATMGYQFATLYSFVSTEVQYSTCTVQTFVTCLAMSDREKTRARFEKQMHWHRECAEKNEWDLCQVWGVLIPSDHWECRFP